ncbi:MAG: 30S ribosomal protein S6 [Candidatus Hydrogenedentes bacterium]|nr:30S ribosomal protein S6 [Candidatus Hydrogenedentota bacterium]
MRTYEALYIISPELDDSAIQTVVADVEKFITSSNGTIVRSDVWGKRKLAYTIRKHTEGVYVVLRFLASPDSIKRLEQQLKLTEAVIRYMVLYLDEKTLKLEQEQARRYEEELRLSTERRNRREDDDDDDDDEDDSDSRRRGRDFGSRRNRSEDDDDDDGMD